jgi:hypothetical protein
MLPKPIKIKKSKSEQLDLVDELSEKKHIIRKQRWLFISLGLTIGLSLIFYTFRHFRLPQFSLPSLPSIESSIPSAFEININDSNTWSIYVQSNDFTYQKNSPTQEQIDEGINFLGQAGPVKDSILYEKIPKGVTVRQIITPSAGKYQAYFRLTIPNREIYILFNITGSSVDTSIASIPSVVEKIYWHLVAQ